MPDTRRSFSWLLLSDLKLRAGRPLSENLLLTFWDDLTKILPALGSVDAVFLAGDLAWSGQPSDYTECSHFLHRLYDFFRSNGLQPRFFSVPGNHDLTRGPEAAQFASDAQFMTSAKYDELAVKWMRQPFQPFTAWVRRWNFPEVRYGAIPGDFCGHAAEGVVIVGLNTAVAAGAPRSPRIHVSPPRFTDLCGEQLRRSSEDEKLRILLTHHHPSAFENYDLIKESGGIHLHLCGDVAHEPTFPSSTGYSPAVIQAPQFIREDGIGYIAAKVDLDHPSTASVWYREYSAETGAWRALHELHEVLSVRLPVLKPAVSAAKAAQPIARREEPIYIDALRIDGFRSFERLSLNFRRSSTLPGEWTCIAGINGAGKSSILQALSLALLGDPLVRELGGERLNRMRRLIDGQRQPARIELALTSGAENHTATISLVLGDDGQIDATAEPLGAWHDLRSRVVVSYGATRNLSSRIESANENLSADVRRQATLFDPLSQLASAEVLLKQVQSRPLLQLFENVVRQVFDSELQVDIRDGSFGFVVAGKDRVEAVDLPDGFRASAAWLADLCAVWCEKAPERAMAANPADIQAIVLIDEIDVHLHPALQRKLVPRLRAAMPLVQWIVTTHSPLVLANFDRNEIVALDRAEEGNVQPLNRQIMGFTSDQIYEWLMGTTPTGEAIEQVLEQNEATGDPPDETVAALLEVSPEVSEDEARQRVEKVKETIARLKP